MIKGFEDITTPLTQRDKTEVVPLVARELEWRVGKGLALTNRELRARMVARGYHIADAKVREIINYIRREAIVERVVASAEGYYIAGSARELADYCDSLREREAAIRAVRQALESQNTQSFF